MSERKIVSWHLAFVRTLVRPRAVGVRVAFLVVEGGEVRWMSP